MDKENCIARLTINDDGRSLDLSGNYVIFKNGVPIYCGESSRLIGRVNDHKNGFLKHHKENNTKDNYWVEIFNMGAEKDERLIWEEEYHKLHRETLLSNEGDYSSFEFKQKYEYLVEHRNHGVVKVTRPLSSFCENYGLKSKGFAKILYEGKPSYKGWSLVSKSEI